MWEFRTLGSTAVRGNVGKVETEAPAPWRAPSENCYSLHARRAHLSRIARTGHLRFAPTGLLRHVLTGGFQRAYDSIDIDPASRKLRRDQRGGTGRTSSVCRCRLVLREGGRMLSVLGWIAVVSFAVSTVFIIWMLHRAFQYVYVQVSPERIHGDNSVVTNFIELLDQARTSMIVYDDGNDMDGAVYNDTRVIDAVRSKLQSNPDFELKCLFNCNDDAKFRKAFRGEPRVDIRTRSDVRPERKTHYKIIDGGLKAYLSRHELGSSQRRFKIVDCTNVSKRHRSRVAGFVLSKHTEDFATAFDAAKRD